MASYKTLLKDALKLSSNERAQLIDGLLSSLDVPDSKINEIWEEEALKRYEAYKKKRIPVKDIDDVIAKYR